MGFPGRNLRVCTAIWKVISGTTWCRRVLAARWVSPRVRGGGSGVRGEASAFDV